jgi:hypothetical protein
MWGCVSEITNLDVCKFNNTFQVVENGDARSRSRMEPREALSDVLIRTVKS